MQAKAALRQLMGFESRAGRLRRRRRSGVHGPHARTSRISKRQALDDPARPAGRAERREARAGHAHARAQQPGARRERRRRLLAYRPRQHVRRRRRRSICRFHDRNQGNIAHSEIAVRQATETEAAARFVVVTDVVNAYAAFADQPEGRRALSVRLPRSGAAVARDHDLRLPARRRHAARSAGRRADVSRRRSSAYRQALAAYMTSVQQINFAVGKQVIP